MFYCLMNIMSGYFMSISGGQRSSFVDLIGAMHQNHLMPTNPEGTRNNSGENDIKLGW